MTSKERLVRAESIRRRQDSGKITKWQASAEFDAMLDQSSGDLHFYGDTTCLRDTWNGEDVMVFPVSGTTAEDTIRGRAKPSNTGIIVQGVRRGLVVLKPGETTTNACELVLNHFGWPGEWRHSETTTK